jgi:hypothetical protein
VIRKSPIPESSSVIAYVTPTSPEKGKGDQVQAFTMSFTSFINGRKIRRLLDNDTTQPQECTSFIPLTPYFSHHSVTHITRLEDKS